MEETLLGRGVDSAVQEFVTKPLVEAVGKPLGAGVLGDDNVNSSSDPVQAGMDLGRGGPETGDPPVYDTDNPGSNPNVNVDDDVW